MPAARLPEELLIGATEFCELLDISDQTLLNLVSAGVVPRLRRGTYDLRQALPAYVRHIRSNSKQTEATKLSDEELRSKARKREAEAEQKEIELRHYRGEYLSIDVLTDAVRRMAVVFHRRLSGLPDRCAPLVARETKVGRIRDKLREATGEIETEINFIAEEFGEVVEAKSQTIARQGGAKKGLALGRR